MVTEAGKVQHFEGDPIKMPGYDDLPDDPRPYAESKSPGVRYTRCGFCGNNVPYVPGINEPECVICDQGGEYAEKAQATYRTYLGHLYEK
jgi:hypothetical protein